MSLRILTQNLYNGRADPHSLGDALRVHSPDVVAVQELSIRGAEVLGNWGTTVLLDPKDDTTGMGIAVRGPASLDRLEFPHRNPVRAALSSADWGLEADLEIVNGHLVNPIARPLALSRRLRQQEIIALERFLSNGETSRLLVGDLNSSPLWPLYRRLCALATDGASAAGTARRTWGPWPWAPRLLRIDHVFTQQVRILRTSVIRIAGADHSGLLVDLASLR